MTGWNTIAQHFSVGDIIVHNNGRTISDEHFAPTYQVEIRIRCTIMTMSSARAYQGRRGQQPIVYGGLVYAWLEGWQVATFQKNAVWGTGLPRATIPNLHLLAIR